MKIISFAPVRMHPALLILRECPSCNVLRPAGKPFCPFCLASPAAKAISRSRESGYRRIILAAGLVMAVLAALAMRFR